MQHDIKLGNFIKWRQRIKEKMANDNSLATLLPVTLTTPMCANETANDQHTQVKHVNYQVELPTTLDPKQLQAIFSTLAAD